MLLIVKVEFYGSGEHYLIGV